ncbi:hypothetical protein EON65_05175 [archaeon]|nr:MAG: hypothetical protein EON65_05175 [archaeon]
MLNTGLNHFASPLSESGPVTENPTSDAAQFIGSTQPSVCELYSDYPEELSEHNSVNTSINNQSNTVTEASHALPSGHTAKISYDDVEAIESLFGMYDASPTDTSHLAHQLSISCKNKLRRIIQEQEEVRRKAEEEAVGEAKDGDNDSLSTNIHQDTLNGDQDNNSVHSSRSMQDNKDQADTQSHSVGKLSVQNSLQPDELSKHDSKRGILSKRGSKSSFSNLAIGDDDLDDELQNEIFKDIAHYNDDIVCPSYAHFLLDYHMAAVKALGLHQLSVLTWKQFLDDMGKALKNDFDQLQDWRLVLLPHCRFAFIYGLIGVASALFCRLEAGLLTPDAKSDKLGTKKSRKESSSGVSAPVEDSEASEADGEVDNSGNEKESKKEKAIKKKEKVG